MAETGGKAMNPPFGPLTYLYVGSKDFRHDLTFYRDVLGAELVWNFQAFGANVAAFNLGAGPLVLLADHRRAPSVLCIYAVPNLDAAIRSLEKRGWKRSAGPFEVPDGPCVTFQDPSGNEYGLLQPDRPDVLRAEYQAEPPRGEGAAKKRAK